MLYQLHLLKGRSPPVSLETVFTIRCVWHSPWCCHAGEGDLRLVDEAPIANWMTGRLQVFFEGSWSQVCNGFFEVAEVNVVCRQLGFGAGAVVPQFLSEADLATLESTTVFPEIAITASACKGSEERLVDCGQDVDATPDSSGDNTFGRDCLSSNGAGLRIACVASPGTGTIMHSHRGTMTWRLTEQHRYWLCCHANSVCQSSRNNPVELFRTGALSCVTYKWYLRQKHTF